MQVSGQLHAPATLPPGKELLLPLLDRWLRGPQSRSGHDGEENSQPLPGLEPPIIQPNTFIYFHILLLAVEVRAKNCEGRGSCLQLKSKPTHFNRTVMKCLAYILIRLLHLFFLRRLLLASIQCQG